MNRVLRPSDTTIERQRTAADPTLSAWVSANAGSGKTTVLANRVVRLLLEGVEPANILCLTFTKAAAANMSNRVFDRLAAWTTLSDAELDAELQKLGAPAFSDAGRRKARRLFARALDTPGGLKVLTIHAFCERVLHQFPFEANVPAAFGVVDDRLKDELIAKARERVLTEAGRDPDSALGCALACVIELESDGGFQKALDDMLRRRQELVALLRGPGSSLTVALERLQKALGLLPGETLEAIEARILDEVPEPAVLDELIGWLSASGSTDQGLADCLRAAASSAAPAERRAVYLGLCLTRNGELRKNFVTKKLREGRPDLAARMDEEFARLAALLDKRRAALVVRRTQALMTLAEAVQASYEEQKARRGALDFTDLIEKTRALLRNVDAAWVLYKLDGGLDHILVDEAQDTSPEQWDIVRALTAEFTAGDGAHPRHRTVFAVGDEKQSIYGFQGAAPDQFDAMSRLYEGAHQQARLAFRKVPLTQSFRSTADVLGAVDAVFEREIAHRGLSVDAVGPTHETARLGAAGRVEVWPLVTPEPTLLPDKAWNAPFDELALKSPVARLAQRIAEAVEGWIKGFDCSGPCPAVTPGDVLILVRTRNALFDAILRALKRRGVPVAGADRLDVGTHIAVLDLLALGDALLLEEDDLALGCVLKSPLFGFTDDDLLRLAPERSGSLRDALRADPACAEAEARLTAWSAEARALRPFDFYATVLGRDGGRQKIRARLGVEAEDALDEFLRLALAFEQTEAPTLTGFLAWMRAASATIKRDLDVAGSEVRVMTVHGAKGLEAKTVLLADAGVPPSGRFDAPVFTLSEPGAPPDAPDLLVWSPRGKEDPEPVAQARQRERDKAQAEHRRLLYVALTRAEDRLVVAGHCSDEDGDIDEASWYALARDALEGQARTVEAYGGTVLVYSPSGGAPAAGAEPAAVPAPSAAAPDWLLRTAPAEPATPPRVAPSLLLPHVVPPGAARAADDGIPARERGRLLHSLLQYLPGFPVDERADAAARFLAQSAALLDADQRQSLAGEALALIGNPELETIFSGEARTEVAVTGSVDLSGTVLRVSGRVDRLVMTPDQILVVDFKSDRPVPDAVPAAYAAQLALYRAVLSRVFNGRQIGCALLWTASGRLDVLDEAMLESALRNARSAGAAFLDAAGARPYVSLDPST